MKNNPITHDTPFPPDASAGANNAYYLHHCAAIERGPAYAACLSRLHDIAGGRSNERTSECEKTLREGRCVAAGMREQEQLAGQALYYFPRLNKPFLPVSVAGDFGVLITNHTDPALIPAQPKPFGVRASAPSRPTAPARTLDDHLTTATTSGFAEALSAAVAEAADTPAPAPAQTQAWPMMPKPAPTPAPAPKVVTAGPPPKPARPPMLPGETPLQYARRLAAQST
ncbi:hypothetical protein [Massilia sp. TN1-12]|uniref:hypothetical protein n=1 Tax=Massilia paldalensis TaxID=3377675 RepID=UPI00384EB224